jgi:hypothetical protein
MIDRIRIDEEGPSQLIFLQERKGVYVLVLPSVVERKNDRAVRERDPTVDRRVDVSERDGLISAFDEESELCIEQLRGHIVLILLTGLPLGIRANTVIDDDRDANTSRISTM